MIIGWNQYPPLYVEKLQQWEQQKQEMRQLIEEQFNSGKYTFVQDYILSPMHKHFDTSNPGILQWEQQKQQRLEYIRQKLNVQAS